MRQSRKEEINKMIAKKIDFEMKINYHQYNYSESFDIREIISLILEHLNLEIDVNCRHPKTVLKKIKEG